MRRVNSAARLERLVDAAITAFELDLSGLTVLTEAASGPFIATCLTAARAGAERVLAVTRDSRFGAAADVVAYGRELACAWGLGSRIEFSTAPPVSLAFRADVVTNLGFVRPIDRALVEVLPSRAAIALMWEPWELRASDIDFAACHARGIPVIGTCETDARLGTFHFVGVEVVKLLLEREIEIRGSRIGVLASEPFGGAIAEALMALGASVERLDLPPRDDDLDATLGVLVATLDALVLAEHRDPRLLLGTPGGIAPARLVAGVELVHVCGSVDEAQLAAAGVAKHPARSAPFGTMTVTTDYVGPKPVVDLHAAGLAVGAAAARARRAGLTVDQAVAAAEATGLGLRIPDHAWRDAIAASVAS